MEIKSQGGWPNIRLDEITTKIGSGATPRGGKESYKASGVSLIRSMNVYDLRFSHDDLAFIDDDQANALSNVTVEPGDILLNITGASVARCCMVPNAILPARVNQHVAIVRVDRCIADPQFVGYCLVSPQYKHHLLTLAQGGATREALTKSTIEQFEVPYPPLETQREIAGILSAYDDLIENNTRRIQILEEMARAIYREWFVHYRYPGHENDRLVESELGPIPEGWEVKLFGDVVEFQRQNISASALDGGVFAHFSFPAFDANELPLLEDGTEIRSGKLRVPESSVLLSKLNPRIPRVWWPEWDREYDAIASTEFLCLVPGTQLSRAYLYSLCKSEGFQANFERLALGTSTSHQRVKQRDVEALLIVVPDHNVLDEFDRLAQTAYRQVVVLRKQSLVLGGIRDWMLPRLVSGSVVGTSR